MDATISGGGGGMNNRTGDTFLRSVTRLQLGVEESFVFRRQQQVTESMVTRLAKSAELEGHAGCVNCLEWSEDGRLLASGSDDQTVILWDPLRGKKLVQHKTEHTGNIFSVKFVPGHNDTHIVSGAVDRLIQLHDITAGKVLRTIRAHRGRVKRLAVCSGHRDLVWSAAEDGILLQTDLRAGTAAALVNLNAHCTHEVELKCVAMNAARPWQLATGANDPFVRLFDIRKLTPQILVWPTPDDDSFGRFRDPDSWPLDGAQYFTAAHLPRKHKYLASKFRSLAVTYVAFSPAGDELLANVGGEQCYLYDCVRAKPVAVFSDQNSKKSSHARHPNPRREELARRLKQRADERYRTKSYPSAVGLYNCALAQVPDSAIIYANRAQALLKREWEGDSYAALRDCLTAIRLDPTYEKAYVRLVNCLLEMGRTAEARECVATISRLFPARAAYAEELLATATSRPDRTANGPEKGESAAELKLRRAAADFQERFCGHCNTTTDIKEANFFGAGFVVAGSDDGSFFVWSRVTGNITRVIPGDESIVNCLQPHPSICLLATSGIESVVRLWSPAAPVASSGDEMEAAAELNQRRMNEDPLEVVLRSLGYRVQQDADDNNRAAEVSSCRTQ